MSLVKLYFSLNNAYYNIGFCTAIKRGYSHIIYNIFQPDFNRKISKNNDDIVKAFVYTMQNQQSIIFDYLFDCTNLIEFLNTDSVMTLLSFSCHIGDFKVAQLLTEYILDKDSKRDFLMLFLHSACSDHDKICQFFFDSKVVINFTDISMQGSVLTCCNKTIFDILINSVDPEVKVTLSRQFLKESIKKQKAEVVDFLLQKEIPHSDTLFEVVSTKNVEIVNLVLKYYSKPSYINQLSENGTALNKAVIIDGYDIVKCLLSIQGIDSNLYAKNRITPLVSAITNFNLNIINLLLDYYGDNIESQKWQLD